MGPGGPGPDPRVRARFTSPGSDPYIAHFTACPRFVPENSEQHIRKRKSPSTKIGIDKT